MIGQVDAVLVATDKGFEHVERARPFIEAGIPVFIDKPLCDNRADLATFTRWVAEGKPLMSSSSMRYAKEFVPYHRNTYALGQLRHIGITMAKSWETYGIHALESVYPITGPGYVSVQNIGDATSNIVHLRHRDGIAVMRCMGATQSQITRILTAEFTLVGLAGSILGGLAGYVAHLGLIAMLGTMVGADLPAPSFIPAAQGLATGMWLLLGFAYLPWLTLR